MKPQQDFATVFDACCRQHAETLFVVDEVTGWAVRYAELPGLSASLCRRVAVSDNTESGCLVVALRCPLLFTVSYLALLRHGYTLVPVNPALPPDTIARISDAAGANCVVTDREELVSIVRACVVSRASLEVAGAVGAEGPRGTGDSQSVILFTSGTTSTPKGVRLGLGSVVANAMDVASGLGVSRSSFLGILPPFHTNGQVINILVPFLTGLTVFCAGDYTLTSLARFWKSIEERRIEYVDVVPTILLTLLSLRPAHPPDTSSLKYVICGAAPVSREVLEEFESTFAVRILQEYGLTEATCISSMETPPQRRLGTVGKPLPGNEVQIRDRDGQPLPAGRRGEVWIRGDYTMQGYVGGKGDYGLEVRDGWLGTGDLGEFDPDGFLSISGRLKNVIIKGGENIFPEDVERAALRCTHVADAAAVGRKHPFFGEVVALVVVWKDGHARPDDLRRVLEEALPRAWWPEYVHALAAIPRTPSGKILRDRLPVPETGGGENGLANPWA